MLLNTLLVCFMLNRLHKCHRFIVLASNDNTMAEIGLFWIKSPWLRCLQATFKCILHSLSSRLFLRFFMLYFVTATDKMGPVAVLPIFHYGYQKNRNRSMTKYTEVYWSFISNVNALSCSLLNVCNHVLCGLWMCLCYLVVCSKND